ncbi:hypothetical protein AB0I35_22700 [Nocardia sp. NPDC050378]|uniref:hypothetical protein n=1 Tax=Nocardia sp. NPDC050378 TaxID=3155400 RepID=UPI0033DD642C
MSEKDHVRPTYGAGPLVVNGRVVHHLDELSDREFLSLVGKRTGMYIGRTTLGGVKGLLIGYDIGARRNGGPGLGGFREWLMANYEVASNLTWEAQIERLALPDRQAGVPLTQTQEDRVITMTFELLDMFLAERETTSPPSQGQKP